MTVAATLLVSAVLVGWLVPYRLRRADLRRRDPWVLIVAWLLSMAGVAVATVTAIVLLLIPSHGGVFVHHCWQAVQHGSPPQVEAVGGMVGSGLVLALAVRLVVIMVRAVRHRARRRSEHLSVLRLAARAEQGGTLWLEHPVRRALTCTITGLAAAAGPLAGAMVLLLTVGLAFCSIS